MILCTVPAPPDPSDQAAIIGWICLALVTGGITGIGWLVKWLASKLEDQEKRNDFQNRVRALEQVGVMTAINSMQRQDLAHYYSLANVTVDDTAEGTCQKMAELYESLQKPLNESATRLQKCCDDISRSLSERPG